MSIGGVIRRFGYQLRDWALFDTKERICPQWREIQETLRDYHTGWPKVEAALARCLETARVHSPFYKVVKGEGLHAFPVMNKLSLIDYFDVIRNPAIQDFEVHVSSTSGSTGTPFRIVQDVAKRNRVLAELQVFGERAGYFSHEKMLFFRALHYVPFWSMFWSNVWQRDIASLSEERMAELYQEQQKGYVGILAYASTLDVLTKCWLAQGLKGSPKVRTVFAGSEMLSEETRQNVQTFWPNSRCYSRYSNMENGILGQEAEVPQQFQLNWASYYFEVLKFDSDTPADEGELGRIVVTDMYNRAFPMIRYDTGDVGVLVRPENDWPYLTQLGGRRLDLIYNTSGETLSPHLLSTGLWGVKGVRQWQFIQEERKRYRLTFIASDERLARQSLQERHNILQKILGLDAEIIYERIEAFPQLASRKHKMIVQKMKP